MRHVCICLMFFVASAALAAEDTPMVDAFGREWDHDEALVGAFPIDFQSDAWRDFAMRVAREEGRSWKHAMSFFEVEILCSFERVKEKPSLTEEEYDAFLDSDEGGAWFDACNARLYATPQVGDRLYDATLALVALGTSLAGILPEPAARPPLDAQGEPPMEFQRETRERLAKQLAYAYCLLEGADQRLAKVPRVERMPVLLGEMSKLVAEGACASQPSAAAASDLPKDAFGRSLDVRTELRKRLGARMSLDQVLFAMALLDAEKDALVRSERVIPGAVLCSREYRAAHPDHGAEAYFAFVATDEGRAWTTQCTLRLIANGPTPEIREGVREGVMTAIEIGMAMPVMIAGIVKAAEKKGRPEVDFARLLEQMPIADVAQALKPLLAHSRCIADQVVAKIGLEPLLMQDMARLRPALEEAVKLCPAPT